MFLLLLVVFMVLLSKSMTGAFIPIWFLALLYENVHFFSPPTETQFNENARNNSQYKV